MLARRTTHLNRIKELKLICRAVEDDARLNGRGLRKCPPVKIRMMTRSESRKEGFAYYVPATGTVFMNRRTLTMPRADIVIIAIHEIIGHHMHPEAMGVHAESCATSCERKWAKRWGVQDYAEVWRQYRIARARLDKTVARSAGLTNINYNLARDAFAGLPSRMVRLRVELRRVLSSPGEVADYISTDMGQRCAC